jgi:hypothetical protein
MSRSRKQPLESPGQSGHHGLLRGSDFKALHDRIETKTGIARTRISRMSGGTFTKQVSNQAFPKGGGHRRRRLDSVVSFLEQGLGWLAIKTSTHGRCQLGGFAFKAWHQRSPTSSR